MGIQHEEELMFSIRVKLTQVKNKFFALDYIKFIFQVPSSLRFLMIIANGHEGSELYDEQNLTLSGRMESFSICSVMPEVRQLVRRFDLFPRWIPSERPSTRKLSGSNCIQAIRIDLQYNMCIYQYKGRYKEILATSRCL